MSPQAPDDAYVPTPPRVETGYRHAGVPQQPHEGPVPGKADDLGFEEVAVEVRREANELPFRPAGVEFGDAEGDSPTAGWRSRRRSVGMVAIGSRRIGLRHANTTPP